MTETITPEPRYNALVTALSYLEENNIEVSADLRLRVRRLTVKAEGDLGGISATYHDAITGALIRYFEGSTVTGPRNQFRQGVTESFYDAFYLGWSDGGGTFPISQDALDWLTTRVNEEFGHVDGLFQNAKELRKEDGFDFFSWINDRADAYSQTLRSIYNAGVMLAKRGMMLTWQLGNTKTHCPTCQKLNGQKHRGSWYVSRNYIPGLPGAAMQCGGYNCDCKLITDKGEVVTL